MLACFLILGQRRLGEAHKWTLQTILLTYLKKHTGSSQAVEWLRLRLPWQEAQVRSLIGELRSHMSCGQKSKHKTEALLWQVQWSEKWSTSKRNLKKHTVLAYLFLFCTHRNWNSKVLGHLLSTLFTHPVSDPVSNLRGRWGSTPVSWRSKHSSTLITCVLDLFDYSHIFFPWFFFLSAC